MPELWAPFWKNVAKCLLFIEKYFSPCGIMCMVFIMLSKIWAKFLSKMDVIMGSDFASK